MTLQSLLSIYKLGGHILSSHILGWTRDVFGASFFERQARDCSVLPDMLSLREAYLLLRNRQALSRNKMSVAEF